MKLNQEDLGTLEEAAGEAEMDFRTDYSGRGMYGKTCVGVTGDTAKLVHFVLLVGEKDLDFALDNLTNMSQDSMGLDTIFYWPQLNASACEYPTCDLGANETVNGKQLCEMHASEYEDYLEAERKWGDL